MPAHTAGSVRRPCERRERDAQALPSSDEILARHADVAEADHAVRERLSPMKWQRYSTFIRPIVSTMKR